MIHQVTSLSWWRRPAYILYPKGRHASWPSCPIQSRDRHAQTHIAATAIDVVALWWLVPTSRVNHLLIRSAYESTVSADIFCLWSLAGFSSTLPLFERRKRFLRMCFVRFAMPSKRFTTWGAESKTSLWGYCVTNGKIFSRSQSTEVFEGCDCETVVYLLDLGLSKGAVGEVAGQSADDISLILIRRRETMWWLARSINYRWRRFCHRRHFCASLLGQSCGIPIYLFLSNSKSFAAYQSPSRSRCDFITNPSLP